MFECMSQNDIDGPFWFLQGGYKGFYARNTIPLTPKIVNDIHKRGGTILGTSRGGHSKSKIVDSIQDRGINQVHVICLNSWRIEKKKKTFCSVLFRKLSSRIILCWLGLHNWRRRNTERRFRYFWGNTSVSILQSGWINCVKNLAWESLMHLE